MATPALGVKNEEAILIPPIDIKVPAVTIAPAHLPKNFSAAEATGVAVDDNEAPNIPILFTCINI